MSVSESNPDAAAASNCGRFTGYMPARVVHVAVQLGVADLLAGETKTADALAQETNTPWCRFAACCWRWRAWGWSNNSNPAGLP